MPYFNMQGQFRLLTALAGSHNTERVFPTALAVSRDAGTGTCKHAAVVVSQEQLDFVNHDVLINTVR